DHNEPRGDNRQPRNATSLRDMGALTILALLVDIDGHVLRQILVALAHREGRSAIARNDHRARVAKTDNTVLRRGREAGRNGHHHIAGDSGELTDDSSLDPLLRDRAEAVALRFKIATSVVQIGG